MPKFAIAYHLNRSDHTPQETIEADSHQDAANLIAAKFSDVTGAIILSFGEDLYAVPKSSVAYCHIRHVVERRRAASNINLDDLDIENEPSESA